MFFRQRQACFCGDAFKHIDFDDVLVRKTVRSVVSRNGRFAEVGGR